MYVIIDIECKDGILSITCSNDYGFLRQCFTYEQAKAVGLGYIIDEVEYRFFYELFYNELSKD